MSPSPCPASKTTASVPTLTCARYVVVLSVRTFREWPVLYDPGDIAAMSRELATASRRVRHPELPLHVFVGDLPSDDDLLDEDGSEWIVPEHDRQPAHARRGALIVAAEEIIDTCIDDLQYLDFEPDGSQDARQADESFVYRRFPPRHRSAYDEQFFRKVLVCAIKVAHDLANPNGARAACTAEEIVRDAVVEHALALCEHAGLGPPELHPTEFLLEDADYEFLYDADKDGIEDDHTLQVGLGIVVPGVEDWFAPFNDDRVVHPYAETTPTQRYSMHDLRRRLDDNDLDPSVLASTDVIDSAEPLSGLTPISQLVAQARRTGNRHDPDLWVADESDPEGSFAELVRMTTLSDYGSGWISWEAHEDAETVRTDRVITFSPHRHFLIGHDEPWAEAAIGIGRIIAIPLSAVVSYKPDPDVYHRWNGAFAPTQP